jgi:4-hydroxybenzoate polyprenyltransferase
MSSSAASRPGSRWRAHLSLARISNSPTVASNVLAGAALGQTLQVGPLGLSGTTLLIMLAMTLFYTAGMYLNDLLDYDLDVRERPDRPLPSGAVSRGEAMLITVLLFAAGLGLLALVSQTAVLGGLALSALIAVYDRWHKGNPLSPLLMASTRMLVYLIAALALAPALTVTTLNPALIVWTVLLGLYIVGLTYIAKTERRPGLARYWPAALLVLPAAYSALHLGTLEASPLLPVLLLAFLAWLAYCLSFLYLPARRDVGRTVGSLIAGVSLLDALVLAHQGAPALPLLLAISAFALTLFWQRFIKGT